MPSISSVRSRRPNVIELIKEGEPSFGYRPRPATIACQAPPGSPEKINELTARLECGEELWHPDDKNDHPAVILDSTEWSPGPGFLTNGRPLMGLPDDFEY